MYYSRKSIILLSILLLFTLTFVGCQKEDTEAPAIKEPEELITEYETDVIIVGGGGAGLAAAAAASQEGAEVIVLEKMSILGGNTLLSGGVYNAVHPEKQQAEGIEDSEDLFFQHTYEGGDKQGKSELVKILVENATDDYHWLESIGVDFEPGVHQALGAMWARSHGTTGDAGSSFINAFKNTAEENGAKFMLNTEVTDLKLEDGKVVGVKAVDKEGNELTLKSRKGVVIATGGFSSNVELRSKYNSALGPELPSTNQPGSTGDGIIMAEKAAANLIQMDYIQLNPFGDPDNGSLLGCLFPSVEEMIYVNLDGKRFIDEGQRRDKIIEALLEQPESTMFIISDSKCLPENGISLFGEKVDVLFEKEKLIKADTIEELAEKIDIDPETLVKTIEDFNKSVDSQVDEEFGRTYLSLKLDQAPFIANKRVPTVHHTMGGLDIDESTRVLDKDGQPIPGLYAAGEVCGGIHGANRLGGNAITDIVVFGRLAGQSAATGK